MDSQRFNFTSGRKYRTLIRLSGYADLFEYLLYTHANLYLMLDISSIKSKFYKGYPCMLEPVLSGHSKIDITEIFMTNGAGSLMKVESIAKSPWSILQYF